MTDVLVYDKDYRFQQAENGCLRWHSHHRVFADLLPGDRLWVVTSGKSLGRDDESAGYLVAMWPIQQIVENPGDDPEFPARKFGHRILVNQTEALLLDQPVCVDHIIRGEGYDLGITGYSGKTTISNRVAEKLVAEGQLLNALDPKIMIEHFGLWPHDQEAINVKTLADYFTQLTHLPRLNNASVLPECLAKGVHRGLFAYALGDGEKKDFDTIYLNDKAVVAADCEITETAWLVRPALAKTLMPEPEPVTVTANDGTSGGKGMTTVTGGGLTGTGDDWAGKGGKVVIKGGERRLNKVRVEIKNLPWENWHDVYNEVIQPLANEGTEVHCQVVVIAKGDAAIRENTVGLGSKSR